MNKIEWIESNKGNIEGFKGESICLSFLEKNNDDKW